MDILTIELMACGMIPAALGRCDPGHIMWNGLMLIPITASFLGISKKLSRTYAAAAAIFCLVMLPYSIITSIPAYASGIMENQLVGKFFYSDTGRSITLSMAKMFGFDEEKVLFRFSKGIGNKVPDELERISDVAMPFEGNNETYIYLTDHKKFHYLPYLFTQGNGKAIMKNFNALVKEKPEYLLLDKGWENGAAPSSPAKFLSFLFATKFSKEPIRNSNELLSNTVNYIKEAYEFVCDVQYYRVMQLYRLKDSTAALNLQ